MPSLSSGYRDGTSEKAKRHARIRAAALKFKAERDAGEKAAGRVYGGYYRDPDRFYLRLVRDGLADAYFMFGESDAMSNVKLFMGGRVPGFVLADWLEEHDERAGESSFGHLLAGLRATSYED